jgi:hypothetical protein
MVAESHGGRPTGPTMPSQEGGASLRVSVERVADDEPLQATRGAGHYVGVHLVGLFRSTVAQGEGGENRSGFSAICYDWDAMATGSSYEDALWKLRVALIPTSVKYSLALGDPLPEELALEHRHGRPSKERRLRVEFSYSAELVRVLEAGLC